MTLKNSQDKELKELISEGRILNFKSLVSEVLPDEFFQAEADDKGKVFS